MALEPAATFDPAHASYRPETGHGRDWVLHPVLEICFGKDGKLELAATPWPAHHERSMAVARAIAMQGTQRLGAHAEWSRKHGIAGDVAWSALTPMALILIPAVLAIVADSAFLFVSLGPIIFQAIERPLAPASSPRSTILGNGIALVVGYACLAAFGLLHAPSSLEAGVTVMRAGAVVVAIGATGALITLVRAIHPPAGATALFVTLGILKDPEQLAIVFAGVVIISACACALDRLAGIPMPIWSPRKS